MAEGLVLLLSLPSCLGPGHWVLVVQGCSRRRVGFDVVLGGAELAVERLGVINCRLTVLLALYREDAHPLVQLALKSNEVDLFAWFIVLRELSFRIVLPFWKGHFLFLRQPVLEGEKPRALYICVLEEWVIEFRPPVGVDLDHFKIFFALFQVVYDLQVLFVLVGLLEVLQQLEEDRISHLKSTFLCFFKKIVVFIL
jgi:hypothetical protein